MNSKYVKFDDHLWRYDSRGWYLHSRDENKWNFHAACSNGEDFDRYIARMIREGRDKQFKILTREEVFLELL